MSNPRDIQDDPAGKNLCHFVGSQLDDYGLTPAQFRVHGHIARRGMCYAGLDGMAKVCKLHPDTVIECLRYLVNQSIVSKEIRPGRTSIFRLRPCSDWLPPGNKGVGETEGHPSKSGDTPRKRRGDTPPKARGNHPPESEGYEGIPLKDIPVKEIPLKALISNASKKFPGNQIQGAALSDSEVDLIRFTRALVGDRAMTDYGGLYRNLLRSNPGKFRRVLQDMESQIKEGKKFRNAGGYLKDTFERFQ